MRENSEKGEKKIKGLEEMTYKERLKEHSI